MKHWLNCAESNIVPGFVLRRSKSYPK